MMLRTTLSGLRGQLRRLVATTLAVVFGVAFVAGSLIFGDTARAGYVEALARIGTNVDVVVQPATDGTAPINGWLIRPSRCRNLSNDRNAVTVSLAAPRDCCAVCPTTKSITSAARSDAQSIVTSSRNILLDTNGRKKWTYNAMVVRCSPRSRRRYRA